MVGHSLVWRLPVAKLAENPREQEETGTDFRLYGCHEPWSQWTVTPESFQAMVAVEEGSWN